jgi:predicted nuclease with TOPRIM domain
MSDELRECVVCGCQHLSNEITQLQASLDEYKGAECRAVKKHGEALRENERLQADVNLLAAELRSLSDELAEAVTERGAWKQRALQAEVSKPRGKS